MQGVVIKMNRASSMKVTLSRCSSACLKKAWGSGSQIWILEHFKTQFVTISDGPVEIAQLKN